MDTTKWQEMAISSGHTQGLCARPAEIQAITFLAVLLDVAGRRLTVNGVVRAIAVAALLALPVRPECLISGQSASVAHAATITACHTEAVVQSEAFLALTALLAWQRARRLRFVQAGTGQRAGGGALIKMTVLWTRQS